MSEDKQTLESIIKDCSSYYFLLGYFAGHKDINMEKFVEEISSTIRNFIRERLPKRQCLKNYDNNGIVGDNFWIRGYNYAVAKSRQALLGEEK